MRWRTERGKVMAKLFLIAGHGAGDPGACGNGYMEAERVRVLAERIKVLGGGNVMLADTSRNWYKDNGISHLTISKEYQIAELHMDSSKFKSARGGHVIINGNYPADKYDKALANFIEDILPGRAEKIEPRTDLANPKRAAAKGYSYRLVECGFISNATDVGIFNSRMDDIARGVLNAFGIPPLGSNAGNNTASPGNGTGSFLVRVLCDLNIRTGPGVGYTIAGCIKDKGTYTIVETKDVNGVPWGKLKSGAGWISIHQKYVQRV